MEARTCRDLRCRCLLDVAEATVRGWLRRADQAAGALYRHGLNLAAVLPWATCPPACPAPGEIAPPTALARALSELAGAARGFTRARPPAQPASDTGIDYLHQLHAAADGALCAGLHLYDPSGRRHTLPAWPAINVLTRGRLPAAPDLTAAPPLLRPSPAPGAPHRPAGHWHALSTPDLRAATRSLPRTPGPGSPRDKLGTTTTTRAQPEPRYTPDVRSRMPAKHVAAVPILGVG